MALLLKSKLVLRIALAVFGAIILVETAILVPSYFREETRLQNALIESGSSRVESLIWAVQAGYLSGPDVIREALDGSEVLGFAYLDKAGDFHSFGQWEFAKERSRARTRMARGDQLTVTGINQTFGAIELAGLRLNAEQIKYGLVNFVARITGLVLLIAAFVTAVTLFVLNKTALNPISSLRRYFQNTPDITAADAVIPEDLLRRDDDLGDLTRALKAVRDLLIADKSEIMRLAALVGESPGPVLRLNQSGELLYANDAGHQLVNKQSDEFNELSELCGVALRSDETINREVELNDKLYSLNLVPVVHAGYVNIYGQDVTLRRDAAERLGDLNQTLEERASRRTTQLQMEIAKHEETERLLALSEERARDFASSTSDFYWEMDQDLRFSFFSAKFSEVTGVLETDLLGKTREETGIPDVDKASWEEHLAALHEHRPFRNFVHPRTLDDGRTVHLSISGIPIFDKDGTFAGFRGSGSDVTKQVAAQTELIRAKETADAASSAKSQFLASMSHELRTPLNAIIGFSQVLASMVDDNERRREAEYIQYILSSGELLLSFISQLLDLSKIEAGELRITKDTEELQSLITDSVAMIQLRAEKDGVKIVNEVDELGRVQLETDGHYVRQILLNLLSNAVKYNDSENGEVRISAAVTDQNMLRITVTDNGPGISSEQWEDIFVPFSRLGREGGTIEGTGLGLHLSQHLAQLLGGDLGFERERTSGCQFCLSLPMTNKVAEPSQQDAAMADAV